MPRGFDHEKLIVYGLAQEFATMAEEIAAALPRSRNHYANQLRRASTSIPFNIGEGAGEFSPPEKARFYRIARRSATECAAILDSMRRTHCLSWQRAEELERLLARVTALLVGLCKSREAAAGLPPEADSRPRRPTR